MIYDYFRVTGAHDTVLDYADFFSIKRERQDLDDSRWVRFNTLKELLSTAKGKLSTRDSDDLRTNILRHFHGKKMTSSDATSIQDELIRLSVATTRMTFTSKRSV